MDQCARERESLYQLELSGINEVLEGFYMTDPAVKSYFQAETERNYLTEYHFRSEEHTSELQSH